ncbi:TetR/AcrR family transcriptional regulator C-terminal ligand-binding domain-containing protein [Variovorax sp. LT1P1]|uniref:TetR/AcrR family transcriptional regulator n=1 Tax=Variovorax sp. LT1P1 TaxID=3443730 RepID=UPI003F450A79
MHATPPPDAAPAAAPCSDAPRRRGRPRSDAATAAVLDAAYRLSATEGLRGATIQAIAAESGVSKMTIYKWWEGRLQLLIDAYMRQATVMLPLSETLPPPKAIHAHVQQYLVALRGDLGRVQLAVLAECMAETGNSEVFVARYLSVRRALGVRVIRRGQRDGSIASPRPAEALYDQIYGTIFYRFQFGLKGLDKGFVQSLVDTAFAA